MVNTVSFPDKQTLTEEGILSSVTTTVQKDDGPRYQLRDLCGVCVGASDEPFSLIKMAVKLSTPLRIYYRGEGVEEKFIPTNRRGKESKPQQRLRLRNAVFGYAIRRNAEIAAYRRRIEGIAAAAAARA